MRLLLLYLLPWTLPHCRNVARLYFFYRFYFGKCSSELPQVATLPFSQRKSTIYYFDRLCDFPATSPTCYNYVCVNSFFRYWARLWNLLPIECFLWIYNQNIFKSRINRTLSSVNSFKTDFLWTLIFLYFSIYQSSDNVKLDSNGDSKIESKTSWKNICVNTQTWCFHFQA